MLQPPPSSTLFPYTTLFRSAGVPVRAVEAGICGVRDPAAGRARRRLVRHDAQVGPVADRADDGVSVVRESLRSEEHTSELQSPVHLVCRLLLEKKNIISCPY